MHRPNLRFEPAGSFQTFCRVWPFAPNKIELNDIMGKNYKVGIFLVIIN